MTRSRSVVAARDDLVVAMTGASGAPLCRAPRCRCSAGTGRTIHLTLSPSAVQVLREEMDLDVRLDSFDPAVFGGLGARPHRLSSPPGFRARGSPAARSGPAAWSSYRAA